MPYARFALMFLALGVFAGIAAGVRLDLALTGIMIAVGINYAVMVIFLFVSNFLLYMISVSGGDMLTILLALVLQSAFIVLLFRVKRFRKGILFLQKRGAGAIGLVISGIVLLAVVLFNDVVLAEANDDILLESLLWYALATILCAAGLIFWWRSGLTKLYRERVKERNKKEYEKIIANQDGEILKLKESNDLLAKFLHTDNKILMAMRELVMLYHDHYSGPDITYQLNAGRYLDNVEELIMERMGAITQSQRANKILPSTKDTLIDGVMRYMLLKASEEEIQFDITVIGNISELTETIIPAIKFETLCADLIENAIIAASHSEYKRILIAIGTEDGFYELNVQDTGIPFEIGTLLDLGQKRASTHLDEGGSGIGYMAIFEILHEFKASIIITEYMPQKYGFTKSVKIRFDNQDEYIVQTFRANEFTILPDSSENSPIVLNLF